MRVLNKHLRKPLVAALVAMMLVVNVLPAFVGRVAAADTVDGSYINEQRNQQAILESIKSIRDARTQFLIDTTKFDDVMRDFDFHSYKETRECAGDSNAKGFCPRATTPNEVAKFKGNPWLEWSSTDGGVEAGQNVAGLPVRFVLTEVMTRDSGEASEWLNGLKLDGVVWIFSQEYNPKIKVVAWARNGVFAEDWNRFVWAGDCYGTVRDNTDTRMANVKFHPDPDELTDNPGSDDFKKQAERYGLKDSVCRVDQGIFATMIGKALGFIREALTGLLGTVLGWIKSVVNLQELGSTPGLIDAWKTFRDFVNLVFVLVLIAIAFSNILRFDTERYGIRALLPRLIFAIIAVNFSYLLMQILVNLAYILSNPFLSQTQRLLTNPPIDGSLLQPEAGIGRFVVAALIFIGVIIALLILWFFFIIRVLMIWFLTALSPFVFLFMVLPITRSLASSWWKNALKWVFMAPIAFAILFIAAELISGGTSNSNDTNDPNFILKIAFFAGAAIAAVIIPLKLGGEVLSRASRPGKAGARMGGKLGAKAGIAGGAYAAGKVPTGGGLSLRDRTNTMQAGWKARNDLRDARANERLMNQIGSGSGFSGWLAGADKGQQLTAFDSAVGKAAKEMNQVTPDGNRRIAHAAAFGMKTENGKTYALDKNKNIDYSLGEMREGEEDFAHSRVHSAAAFQSLARVDQAGTELTQQKHADGWSFARTGYQQLSAGDPLTAAIDRDGTISPERAEYVAKKMDAQDFKRLDDDFLDVLSNENHPQHRVAVRAANAAGAVKWGNAVDARHRMKMDDPQKREKAFKAAEYSRDHGYSTLSKPIADQIIRDYNDGKDAVDPNRP